MPAMPHVAIATLVAIAGLVAACAGFTPPSHAEIAGKPDLTIDDASSQLKHSKVVAQFQAPIAPGESLLWCSTMQLAWNELGTLMTGGEGSMRLSEPAGSLAPELMHGRGSTSDLSSDCYVACAGMGPATIDTIKRRLSDTFKGQASPKLLPASLGPDDLLAYAYLFKNLEFAKPFITSERPMAWKGPNAAAQAATTVDFWGSWQKHEVEKPWEIREQVSVMAYDSPEHWAVEIATKSTGDRLIIARLDPKATLAATCDEAMALGHGHDAQKLASDDVLQVPYLNFDVTRAFKELVGVGVSGKAHSGTITAAIQNIRFRLDERGAVLKSEAAITVTSAMPMGDKPQPKVMICDGPFLVILCSKEASTPYFAAWIANPELLSRTH
jgi:hypothetical protein